MPLYSQGIPVYMCLRWHSGTDATVPRMSNKQIKTFAENGVSLSVGSHDFQSNM